MNKKISRIFSLSVFGAVVCGSAHAASIETGIEDFQVTWVSNLTAGLGIRTKQPSCTLTGDPNAFGCGASANTAMWGNGDDGDLNYRKGQPFSAYTSFTSELLMAMPERGYKFLIRTTGQYDFGVNDTDRTALSADAKSQAVDSIQLLDFWAEKDFNIGAQRAHFRLGNQVINWGESYFASGGVNATNSLDIQKLLIPGTQLKQALLPAPMLSFATSMPDGFTADAYYQFLWNSNRYPPVGTFWSTSNVYGRGAGPASYNYNNFNIAGLSAPTIAAMQGLNPGSSQVLNSVNQNLLNQQYNGAPFYAYGGETLTVLPGNKPQMGMRVGYKPSGADVSFAFYYENYTDKSPVVSYLASGTTEFSYLQNRSLFGISSNVALGDWAIGSELSYRPHDAVAMSGCFGPGGAPDANSNGVSGINCNAWKDMKKYQFDVNAQINMTQTTHPVLKLINADMAVFTAELTAIDYPGVNASTRYQSTVNGKPAYQLVDAGYAAWLSSDSANAIVAAQGTAVSVGATVDFNWTYDGTVIPGWQLTPGITFYDSLSGYTPSWSANYESGAKSANLYLLFNQNPIVWQAGLNFTAFFGGNAASQPYSDRNFVGAFVTRNF